MEVIHKVWCVVSFDSKRGGRGRVTLERHWSVNNSAWKLGTGTLLHGVVSRNTEHKHSGHSVSHEELAL